MGSRALPGLALLLFGTCAGGEDAGGGGGTAGDGTERLSTSMGMPADEADCPPCEDSATWVSAFGMFPCASYAIGEINEGYCDDDGATEYCPLSCDACPSCLPSSREVNIGLMLAGLVCVGVCCGVATAKHFVDLARLSGKRYRVWREAQDEKMSSIQKNNTVRKARDKFKAFGAASKLKAAAKLRKGSKVAPTPADMRTEQEEAELRQLDGRIARDQESLQRLREEGNGESQPCYTLQGQLGSATARQAELQSKRPYDHELVQRMLLAKEQREAAEAAQAAASVLGVEHDTAAQWSDPGRQPEPEPEPELRQAGGEMQLQDSMAPPPPGMGGSGSAMRIGGLRGDGRHS